MELSTRIKFDVCHMTNGTKNVNVVNACHKLQRAQKHAFVCLLHPIKSYQPSRPDMATAAGHAAVTWTPLKVHQLHVSAACSQLTLSMPFVP